MTDYGRAGIREIPNHLQRFSWYAQHLAYLKTRRLDPLHDPGNAKPMRADLWDDNLRETDLHHSDLRECYLRGCNLSGSDLREARWSHDLLPSIPVIRNIDRAILAAIEAGGKLEMRRLTQCRGAWAILFAGAVGLAYKKSLGVNTAAALIYAASRPGMRVPNFYASNEDAMKDLRACAAMEL